MQGVFVRARRVATKKALKEAAVNGDPIALEATSVFGNEYNGFVQDAPNGTYTVVGPNPHTDRKWYATITVTDGKATVK